MTHVEFEEWLSFHFARFTAAAGWLAKFPINPRNPADPTQRSIIDGWRDILRAVELKHAKTASQLLAHGEEPFIDRTYDCHPVTIRKIASRLSGVERQDAKRAPRIIDGEEVFDCGACKDSGIVTLWHPTALKYFKQVEREHLAQELPEGEELQPINWHNWYMTKPPGVYESCVVKCTCEAGQMKKNNWPIYNEDNHVLFGNGKPQEALDRFSETPGGGWGLDTTF